VPDGADESRSENPAEKSDYGTVESVPAPTQTPFLGPLPPSKKQEQARPQSASKKHFFELHFRHSAGEGMEGLTLWLGLV
jgi:hypothetical protein